MMDRKKLQSLQKSCLIVNILFVIPAALLGARFRDTSTVLGGSEDGDIGPDAFPPASVMGRRRSRAVLYPLSGHFKPEKVKTKLKINNVSKAAEACDFIWATQSLDTRSLILRKSWPCQNYLMCTPSTQQLHRKKADMRKRGSGSSIN